METKCLFCTSEVKGIDTERREIRFHASTDEIDRDGDVILPTAFKEGLKDYLKNPVIMACHQHRLSDGKSPVVGRAEKVWTDSRGLWVVVKFAQTALAAEYWQLYRDGFMKAVSIGFRTKKSHNGIVEDKHVRIIDEVELYEISLVPVPANAGALAKTAKDRKADFIAQKREERSFLQFDEAWEKAQPGEAFFVDEYGDKVIKPADEDAMEFAEAILNWDGKKKQSSDDETSEDEAESVEDDYLVSLVGGRKNRETPLFNSKAGDHALLRNIASKSGVGVDHEAKSRRFELVKAWFSR